MIVTTSQLTMTNARTERMWGPPTIETAVISTANDQAPLPDCDWEWRFSALVDSICPDYEGLPSFMSLSFG